MEHSEDECRGAVFMVQPEEIPQYKAIRRTVDKVFLARDQFLSSSVNYTGIPSGNEGVNRHLRAMLFRAPKRLRRGVRRSEVVRTGPGIEEDGSENCFSAVKQTQRQSKQKERCENRLMSLLFATIYDPATKQCHLVQGAPPLKLRRQDKNGLFRNVSNYTEVRMYLRNAMASILSGHTEGVKHVERMLPSIFKLLPLMFTLIGRPFFLMLSCDTTDEPSVQSEAKAMEVLNDCMSSIQDYITTWERRNFTTDNRLTFSLEAGVENECYISIRDLLEAMIAVLGPRGNEPFDLTFRKRAVYVFALYHGCKCGRTQRDECLLGKMCPKGPNGKPDEGMVDACLKYIRDLTICASMAAGEHISSLDQSLNDSAFALVVWDNNCATTSLHRLDNLARIVQAKMESSCEGSDDLLHMFVQQVQTDVARCWGAFGRSNSHAASILGNLEIPKACEMRATVTELVFGGVAATTLFEREREIISICAKLRSKKGPQLLMMNEGSSDTENEVIDRNIENIQRGGQSPVAEEVTCVSTESRKTLKKDEEGIRAGGERDLSTMRSGAPNSELNDSTGSQERAPENCETGRADNSRCTRGQASGEVSFQNSNQIAEGNQPYRRVAIGASAGKSRIAVHGNQITSKNPGQLPSNGTQQLVGGSPKHARLRQGGRKKRRRIMIQKVEGRREHLSTPARKTRKKR